MRKQVLDIKAILFYTQHCAQNARGGNYMKLNLDRYEGDYLVFVDEEGMPYDYLKDNNKIKIQIGDMVEGCIIDGKLVSFELIPGERERIAKENASIIERLKSRMKKDN